MNFAAKSLSGDALLESLKEQSKKVPDHRHPAFARIELSDILIAGFAIFSLKFPSLLEYDEQMRGNNLGSRLRPLYRIHEVPSDTQLRTVLDEVDPEHFKKPFKQFFSKLQRSGKLRNFEFFDGPMLASERLKQNNT